MSVCSTNFVNILSELLIIVIQVGGWEINTFRFPLLSSENARTMSGILQLYLARSVIWKLLILSFLIFRFRLFEFTFNCSVFLLYVLVCYDLVLCWKYIVVICSCIGNLIGGLLSLYNRNIINQIIYPNPAMLTKSITNIFDTTLNVIRTSLSSAWYY